MAFLSARPAVSPAAIGTVFRFVSGDRDCVADAAVVADPTFGNPREMPLPSMVEAIRAAMRPQNPAWFAGKTGARDARAADATSRRGEPGLPFEPADLVMTKGAFGAIARAFVVLRDPAGECIVLRPGWFCCATTLRARNAVPDPERPSLAIAQLEAERGRLHGALTQWGSAMTKPQGTFDLWGHARGGGAAAFSRGLAARGVFVMPAAPFDRPSDLCISLTATAALIEAAA
jgi:aspartate/methionine/tyrosine aminotransferase